MKKLTSALVLSLALAGVAGERVSKPEDVAKLIPHESAAAKQARMAWWVNDRFGLFIHFGLYAMPARGEWVRNRELTPNAEYDAKYFGRFDPDLFDAKAWARQAKAAGMKYAVLTAKHHEGFCLFDSKFTDYKVTNTPFKRDLVREFADAFRAEGLKVGFYYSLIDWHHPDFTVDMFHPLRNGDREALNRGRDMAKYRKYLVDQVTELLTNYGKIDIVWFDFSYPGKDGKSRDDWDSPALVSLARRLQPGVIIDNRADLNDVKDGCDFITPEQFRVTEWPKLMGERFPWETCQTFSGAWGYHRDETSWKSEAQCLELLIDTVAHGGNLIMNVGPTGRGEFDGRAQERLAGYAKWMRVNGRSIYGCTQAPDEFKAPPNSLLTYNPKTRRLYVHLLAYPQDRLRIEFPDKVAYAQFLHDASELSVSTLPDWQLSNVGSKDEGKVSFINLPIQKPDVTVPVIELFLK